MIIFTIVYPKNERLIQGATEAIYERFGACALYSSPRVIQYFAKDVRGFNWFLNFNPKEEPERMIGPPDLSSPIYKLVRNRNSDVPWTTEQLGNYGITTEDVFMSYMLGNVDSPLNIDSYLNFGTCRISFLGKRGRSINAFTIPRVGVKLALRNLALDYLQRQRIIAEVRTDWQGELEGMIEAGLTDFVIDSVETGRARDGNDLIEYDKIMDSRAIWIQNTKIS